MAACEVNGDAPPSASPAAQEGGVGLNGHGAVYLPVLYRDSQFIHQDRNNENRIKRGNLVFLYLVLKLIAV